jgi:polar amino acid transport system substrate-binding protein
MLAATLLVWLAGAVAPAPPLTVCFEDVPMQPWTMPDGSGLNLALLHRVEAATGERFAFVRRPWKRCMEEARTGKVDAVVGSADTPERRTFGSFPTLPDGAADQDAALYSDSAWVYLRSGGGGRWNGAELAPGGGAVIAQTGYHAAELLAGRGLRVHGVKTAEEGLRLLASGAADVAVLQSLPARRQVGSAYRATVQLAPKPFVTLDYYLMFSRAAFARDPARAQRIWAAIAAARRDPAYRALERAALR